MAFEETYQRLSPKDLHEMLADRSREFPLNNPFRAQNLAQWMYARKTGADFAAEMASSVQVALKNWHGELL